MVGVSHSTSKLIVSIPCRNFVIVDATIRCCLYLIYVVPMRRIYLNGIFCVQFICALCILAVKILINKDFPFNHTGLELHLNPGQGVVPLIGGVAHRVGRYTTRTKVDSFTYQICIIHKLRYKVHVNFHFGVFSDPGSGFLNSDSYHFHLAPVIDLVGFHIVIWITIVESISR